MLSFQQSLGDYSLVDSDQDEEVVVERLSERGRMPRLLVSILCIALLGLTIGFIGGVLLPAIRRVDVLSYRACRDPPVRREWRTLSKKEKHDYVDAVQCLRTTPSRLGMNQSLYDDFPWIHTLVGGYCMSFIKSVSTVEMLRADSSIGVKHIVLPHSLPGTVTSYTSTSIL